MAVDMIQQDKIYCHYTKIIYHPRNLEASTEISNLGILNAKLGNTFARPLE